MKSLNYARLKVQSVIETINVIGERDFPYDDPLLAVNFIRDHFEDIKKHLNSTSEPATLSSLLKNIPEEIDNYLLAIGFITGACDVRGALELQGPLRRLTHKALGTSLNLVVSSDWRFSPFTLLYPGEFGNQFVLVGLPITEAGNPLIAPLAGHELGHNIWRQQSSVQALVASRTKRKVRELIENDFWGQFSTLFHLEKKEELDQLELFGDVTWLVAKAWADAQCEEMFCDFVGICIFGESYFHAFQYLISPGGGYRNSAYPSDRDRVRAMLQAAKKLSLRIQDSYEGEFEDSDPNPDPQQDLLLKISDLASQALIPDLIDVASEFCERKGIRVPKGDDATGMANVRRICESFQKVIPATGAASLADIVNAAWAIFLDPKNPWERDYPGTNDPAKRVELLTELTLKSFEVFEIERIQEKQ